MGANLDIMIQAIQSFMNGNGYPPSHLFVHPSDIGGNANLLLGKTLVQPDPNAKPGHPMPFHNVGVRCMSVDCADAPDPKELIRALTSERDDWKRKAQERKAVTFEEANKLFKKQGEMADQLQTMKRMSAESMRLLEEMKIEVTRLRDFLGPTACAKYDRLRSKARK